MAELSRRGGRRILGVAVTVLLAVVAGPGPGPEIGADAGTPAAAAAAPPAEEQAAPGEEVVAERTEQSKTFATETAGVFRTEVYTEPVHYEEEPGEWAELDPALVATGAETYVSEGMATDVEVTATDDVTEVSVDLEGGARAGFALGSDRLGATADDTVEVDGIAPGVDVELEVTPAGLKETLVLASPSVARRFTFPLDLEGVSARLEDDGSVALVDAADEVVGKIPPGWMADSSAHPVTGVPAESFGVTYGLERSGSGTTLVVTLDDAWLDDPSRVYPVRVDPSILQAEAGLDDTYVMAFAPADRSALTQLQVGNNGFLGTRSFIKFPELDALTGKLIHFANLKLFQNGTGSCTPSEVDVYAVASTWDGSTTTTYGGPPVDGPPVARAVAAHGGTGCASDWVDFNITDLVDDWVLGNRYNHGISLRAADEFDATAFKRFGSGNSFAPPHVQVLWSETGDDNPHGFDLVGEPAAGTLRPVLTAPYRDTNHRPGAVTFAVLGDYDRLLTMGTSPLTHSGSTASWQVPEGILAPGMTYSVIAWATNEIGLSSPNSTYARVTRVSDVAFTELAADEDHFGDVSLPVAVADGLTVDRIDLVVDETVVATDASPPYVLEWDTAGGPDGPTEVTAVGAIGPDPTDAAVLSVDVRNETTGPERAEIDRLAGTLTIDEATLITVQAAVEDPATPERYQSELRSGSTDNVLGPIIQYGNGLSQTTKDAIAELLEPSVSEPEELRMMDEDCPDVRTATINQLIPRTMCYVVHNPADPDLPTIKFFYSTEGNRNDLTPYWAADADQNGRPEAVDVAAENMEMAMQAYLDLGYELPPYIESGGLTVAFHDNDGYANPWRRDGSPYSHAITLGSKWDRDRMAATARHEVFHVFQYNYMSTFDVAGDLCPLTDLCPQGGLWWIEATAEWADHKVADAETSTIEGEHFYDRALASFASSPEANIYSHFLGRSRGYGAFIFAESLEERYGPGIILDVFEYIEDNPTNPAAERDLTEALEAALDDESEDLHTELWRFWISFYLLTGMEQDLNFDDPDVQEWREELERGVDDHPGLGGDGFSTEPRLDRLDERFIVRRGHSTDFDDVIGFGGASIIELGSDQDYRDYEEPAHIGIQVNPARHTKLSFGLISLSAYPELCPSGPAGVPDSDGELTLSWQPTDACPRAAVIVTHLDPNSGYGLGGDYFELFVSGAGGS